MKKIIFTALILTSLFVMSACGEKTENVENNDTVSESELQQEEPVTERPTERVREIVASDDFEYEVIDGGAVVTKYIGSSDYVDIPDELGGVPVTQIGFYAFEAKHDVKSVIIPETVTLIGEGAFMDCTSMESINIPEAVTAIERGAFVTCLNLTELTIPANVEYIREEAFTACEGLVTLTINNPDLAYESWGLEELPNVQVIAPEGSAVAQWASELGIY